jgi:hypothetical protein
VFVTIEATTAKAMTGYSSRLVVVVVRPFVAFVIVAVLVVLFSVRNFCATSPSQFSSSLRRQQRSADRQVETSAVPTIGQNGRRSNGLVKRPVASGLQDASATREYVDLDELATLAANGASLVADLRRYVDVQQERLDRLRRYSNGFRSCTEANLL